MYYAFRRCTDPIPWNSGPTVLVPRPKIIKSGFKWVQSGRQDLRVGPRGSHGHFQTYGKSPATNKFTRIVNNKNLLLGFAL